MVKKSTRRTARAGGRGLVVIGGKSPRRQKPKKSGFTKARQAIFLTVLSETCNVTQASREADVSTTNVYKLRKANAAFRAAWREAIAVAYQRLELELLDRAFNGVDKLIRRKDGSEERVKEYSNEFGLRLLKLHRDSAIEADTEFEPADVEEIRERLIGKLQRLRDREAAGDEGGE